MQSLQNLKGFVPNKATVSGDNPFSPIDVPSITGWWAASSLVLNDNDPVGTWSDISGNSNNATAAGGDRPTYKTNVLNGYPVVRCSASKLLLGTYLSTTKTAIIVCNNDGSASTYAGLLTGGVFGMYSYLNVNVWGLFRNVNVSSTVALGSTFKVISAVVYANNDIDLATNGVVVNETSGGTPFAYGASYIGWDGAGSQFHKGDIAEIVTYEDALTEENRELVENYLLTKYGL